MTRLTVVGFLMMLAMPAGTLRAQQPARPTFSASVAVVPITAMVRDSRHRLVRDLARDDFQVLEDGKPRRIVDFKASEDAALNVAFLFDTSGSMGTANNVDKGKEFVADLLTQLHPARDEAALFTFHRSLREEVALTREHDRIRRALERVRPWGMTSLYDAVADTAKRLTDGGSARRAVVVISDGVDTSSALTPQQVAGLASAIDVPVYVVAVVSPLEDPTHPASLDTGKAAGSLSDLARWTGGEVLYASGFEPTAVIRDRLLSMMRHQYLLAIESSSAPGWYPLEVKTKRQGLTVRARRGYFAGDATLQ
jgi:Ca-activated chloride channel family protein